MMRMTAMVAMLAAMTVPASAQPLQTQLSKCLAIPGVLQRLACYDDVAKGADVTATPRAAVTAPVYRQPASTVPPVAASAPPSFGNERLPQTAAAAPRQEQNLIAQVTKVTFDAYGRFTMTLDDGQVWRQVAGDQSILHTARVGTVRISRGALGSYDLTVSGRNASYKVTRLQ